MPKVSRERAQQNREKVIEKASRLFRERGFDGVGIADVMKDAGLTHGGFYAQFLSKEHLMAEACGKAWRDRNTRWRNLLDQSKRKSLSVLAAIYLSKDHRESPGEGCVAATLGVDSAHQGPLVRSQFTAGLKDFLDLLTQLLPASSQKVQRREAITACAAMVGAIVLARGVNDEAFSEEILQSVRAHINELEKTLTT
jgi:TetR/AcrR family transcriptional regulator, transcriptional repressor for nem operon